MKKVNKSEDEKCKKFIHKKYEKFANFYKIFSCARPVNSGH